MWCGTILLIISLLTVPLVNSVNYEESIDNNEFAEFEEFDSEDVVPKTVEPETEYQENQDEEVFIMVDEEDETIDEDETEFEHFQDVEEFEGFESREEKPLPEPKITITKVPIHFRANWDSYWLEILMIAGLVVYFINFATGRSKNSRIANAWFQTHKSLLEDNFSLVGDDGSKERTESIGFTKDSENIYTLWCSGRTCCEGMLVELKLIKRQDMIAVISGMMKPTFDQIHIKVIMNKEDMDPFVFCVASKKTAMHLVKEIADVSLFCPERRSGEKYNIPKTFSIMSEIPEVTSAMLDSKIVAVLNKYTDYVDYIHLSDQYSGPKQTEEGTAIKAPETQKVLLFGFNAIMKGKQIEEAVTNLKPLMVMIFYLMEKVKKYKLSKEAKTKADKNRQRVEEAFLKSTHQSRTEAAAARKEKKRQEEKDKIMSEGDPDRQRRWEEKDQKRQAKKRAPKMKQLKVKAL